MTQELGIHPLVARLFAECPFIHEYVDQDFLGLPTVAFGDVARVLKRRILSDAQELEVWDFLNRTCEAGGEDDLAIVGTGAIELFNDDAVSQSLARENLRGAAKKILEGFRIAWGQPDYLAYPPQASR